MKSYVTLGFRNLSRRRSRSLLTALGVVLAIGFTVGLLSISEGFMSSLDELMNSGGPNLFLRPKGSAKMPFGMQGSAFLDAKLEKIVRGIPGVEYVEPVYQAFSVDGGSTGFGAMMTMVSGLRADEFFKVRPGARVTRGRFYKDNDGKVVVLGAVVAENSKKRVGQTLELISGQKLKVIGIMEKSNEPFDYFAYAPIKTLQEIYNDKGRVSYYLLKTDKKMSMDKEVSLLKRAFPQLDVQSVEQLVEDAKKMMSMARAVHFGVSCFALLIGVLFVACTMIMSVSERIREFATLRVIGASKAFIVKMILSESLLLGAFGGLAGCGLGFILSKMIDALIFHFVGDTFLHTLVSPRIFLTGFLIALLIGTFAGLFPARMILRRNLSESLRYE
jgi:putative ABC transport system permease protein